MARILILWFIVLSSFQAFSQNPEVFVHEDISNLHSNVAKEIVDVVRQNPRALIAPATGGTYEKIYTAFIEMFKADNAIDFSDVRFYNLDNYIGLPHDSLLNYYFYMEHFLFGPLRKIDPKRAPKKENTFMHQLFKGETVQDALKRSQDILKKWMNDSVHNKFDLVLLGLGGSEPIKNRNQATTQDLENYRGAHVGFNEPGSKASDKTGVVELSEHTRIATGFRFQSYNSLLKRGVIKGEYIHDVPTNAITLGMHEILNDAKKIVLAANGEDKRVSVWWTLEGKENPNFPGTLLRRSTADSVSYHFDSEAASLLSLKPWHSHYHGAGFLRKEYIFAAMQELIVDHDIPLVDQKVEHLKDLLQFKFPWYALLEKKYNSLDFSHLKGEFHNLLLNAYFLELPSNQNITVFSPHPDDDVISMGGTIQKLVERGNKVTVVYLTSGSNAVRHTDKLFKDYLTKLQSGELLPDEKDDDIEEAARRLVRENEADRAAKRLGVHQTVFFNADFYKRRGIPSVSPFTKSDISRMNQWIIDLDPSQIYFAAEPDPRGAHGLSKKLVQQSLQQIGALANTHDIEFFGYRGAYLDWMLSGAKDYQFVGFSEDIMNKKLASIRDHESQQDLMVSTDERSLEKRALVRNTATAETLKAAGVLADACVETFKKYSASEFLSE